MRKSVILQGEKAFSQYMAANVLGSILQGMNFYAAHLPQPLPLDGVGNPTGFATLTPPFGTFTGSKPTQIDYDTGIYEFTLSAHVEVQIDDSQSVPGQDLFGPYIEAFRDLMEGNDGAGNLLAYNWLNSASPVNFTCFGLSSLKYITETLQEPTDGRHLVFDVDYYIGATTQPQ
jgi:hypothetical protein